MTTRPVSWIVLAVVCGAAIAQAEPREAVQAPDAEFLEFLGSWRMDDNRWTDPFRINEASGGLIERSQSPAASGRRQDSRQPSDVRGETAQPEKGRSLPRRDVNP